jgi:DNA polymerase-4
VAGRTIAIKVRLSDFRTLNRSRTLHSPTDVAKDIFDTSIALFEALRPGDRIRLLGVRAEGLVNSDGMPRQAALGDRERGWSELERAADAATARFGRSAVRPASLLGSDDAGHQRGAGDTDGERVDWFQMPGPWNSPD